MVENDTVSGSTDGIDESEVKIDFYPKNLDNQQIRLQNFIVRGRKSNSCLCVEIDLEIMLGSRFGRHRSIGNGILKLLSIEVIAVGPLLPNQYQHFVRHIFPRILAKFLQHLASILAKIGGK